MLIEAFWKRMLLTWSSVRPEVVQKRKAHLHPFLGRNMWQQISHERTWPLRWHSLSIGALPHFGLQKLASGRSERRRNGLTNDGSSAYLEVTNRRLKLKREKWRARSFQLKEERRWWVGGGKERVCFGKENWEFWEGEKPLWVGVAQINCEMKSLPSQGSHQWMKITINSHPNVWNPTRRDSSALTLKVTLACHRVLLM